MLRRGLNVNTEELYANTLVQDYLERSQATEEPRLAEPPRGIAKFRTRQVVRATNTASNPRPLLAPRDGSYTDEVQARLAAKRIEEKVREAALRR